MFVDPIVEEVRKNGAIIAAECAGDIRRIAERLRREQAAHPQRVVASPRGFTDRVRKGDAPKPASR